MLECAMSPVFAELSYLSGAIKWKSRVKILLEKRLSRYPQLYSRVGFAHAFRALSVEEILFILAHHWERVGLTLERTDFSDSEAMAAVIRITSGNFRLIHRLFGQIERLLEINGFSSITKEIVEAARECLVIGLT